MIFFDTETCGLHGPIVLLQYAVGDGPIKLHSVWSEPISDTLSLIESIASDPDGVVGFNLAFDWFHVCQLYTTLLLMPDKDAEPRDCVEQYAELEPVARDGPCVKPIAACDIMLHARKGPYQSTMDRGDVRIRRVPTPLAWPLAAELERRIKLKDIYFARRKDKNARKWQVYDIEDEDGDPVPDFKDIVLKFSPSSALKALATDALELPLDTVLLFGDVGIDKKLYPVELGYAPFARAIGNRHNWRGAWPEVIRHHINHWLHGSLARKYAADDVDYTRRLWHHFGCPALGDDDSELACMVAACRWRGYKVDLAGLRSLREATVASKTRADGFKVPTAPAQARAYVKQCMDATELLGASLETAKSFDLSTKKVLLEEIAKWQKECPVCGGSGTTLRPEDEADYVSRTSEQREAAKCSTCQGEKLVVHPAAVRAKEVLAARQADYEADFYDKLLLAGRFHASFSVIGALSSRMGGGGSSAGVEQSGMAGGDGLNAQGVKKAKVVRRQFPLAWDGMVLCVPGDQWTLTAEGPRLVRELVGKPATVVVDGRRIKTGGFFEVGQKEVFEVETVEGHKFQATAGHRILVDYLEGSRSNGLRLWQEVGKLREGDRVCLHNHQNFEWEGEGTWSEGYLLGWVFGDGCYSKREKGNSVRNELPLHPDDHCLLDFIVRQFCNEPNIRYDLHRDVYRISSPELEELRVKFGVGTDKAVTEYLEQASSDFLSGFLSAFFDADGTANKRNVTVRLSQSDLGRLEVVQRTLLRFGINSSIAKEREAGVTVVAGNLSNSSASYTLSIRKANVLVFATRVGFKNPRKRQVVLDSLVKYTGWRKLQSEKFFVRVKAIKTVGVKTVYDVHVPEAHCFDLNGAVAHNCGGDFRGLRGHHRRGRVQRREPAQEAPHLRTVRGRDAVREGQDARE